MTFRSFAKVNLHLEVLGRRDDGYHELSTVFQTVSLHDEISVSPLASGITLEVEGFETPPDSTNLAWRAADRFLELWGPGGAAIRLRKRVPVGGGLGGGSSNAATVLLALRHLYGRPKRIDEMQPVASALGADVPFFLVGGTALGLDRGDRILPAPDLAEEELWIVSPGVSVASATVFSRFRAAPRAGDSTLSQHLLQGRFERPSAVPGRNDLEATVRDLFPAVDQVYTALVQIGAEVVRLSGSGGSIFSFFASPPEESALAASLPEGSTIHRARTLSRRSVEAQCRLDTQEDQ